MPFEVKKWFFLNIKDGSFCFFIIVVPSSSSWTTPPFLLFHLRDIISIGEENGKAISSLSKDISVMSDRI